jgi:glycine/sarcosine N-methyltransferase
MEKILPNKSFFNKLAADYDKMISFEKLIETRKNSLSKIISTKVKSAADIGCGSGADSIALALLGVKVTAFDPSNEMLKRARINSEENKVDIEFLNLEASEIPIDYNGKFDLVVSLGNTFANIPAKKIFNSLKKCFNLLTAKGQLLIQVLNYEKILAEKERIVNITERDDFYFIRFYDFLKDYLLFNILIFKKVNPAEYKIISTKIYPHLSSDFVNGLKAARFNSVHLYSDLNLTKFSEKHSRDLIILASKK